uniref:Nuclear pore complex protein Nup205 n=1 Tax=Rhizophora mucronata TaxID=61149 RepID=A0A2P2MHX6_RHIMU
MTSLNNMEWQAPLENCFIIIISRHDTLSEFKPPGH